MKTKTKKKYRRNRTSSNRKTRPLCPQSYLANNNTKELHNLNNTKTACKINLMTPHHKEPIGSYYGLQQYINNKGYDGCYHCLPQYHTD